MRAHYDYGVSSTERTEQDMAEHGKHADMVGLGIHRGALVRMGNDAYEGRHRK